MPRAHLPFAITTSFVMAMVVSLHEPPLSADALLPAVAERDGSAEESLNPLVDLVQAKRESEAKLREALKKPLTITFENISLKDAMQRLAQAADVNLLINENALEGQGVSSRELISASAKETSLHDLLKRILRPLSLDYEIRSEVILVTTIFDTAENLVTRRYEVGDLLKWEEAHRFERRALSNTAIETHRPHDWLLDVIEQETSGPWIPIDGTGGTAEIRDGQLIVRQTEDVQAEIPALLKMFRLFTEDKFGKDKSVFLESLSDLDSHLAARRAVSKRVTLNFNKTPLKDVAEKLSQEVNVPVRLEESALREEGVSELTPITFQVKNITLESAMSLMLDPLGLEIVVFDGELVITTLIAAEERLHTVAYDVRDLLKMGAITEEFFLQMLWTQTSGPWQGVDGTGGGAYEPLPGLVLVGQTENVQKQVVALLDEIRQREKQRRMEGLLPQNDPNQVSPDEVVTRFYALHPDSKPRQVKKAISDLVDSESWESHGGNGKIRIINNMLLVKTSAKLHRKVSEFLVRISTARDMPQQRDHFPMWGM